MKYAFIAQHDAEFEVGLMCRVLAVSRSGYYAWRRRSPSPQQQANAALLDRIKTLHQQSRQTYGSPRITRALRKQGVPCGHNRVARLMRQAGLVAKMKRAYKVTTQVDPDAAVAPNRLAAPFATNAPNTVWLSDITYIRTQEGWLYLCIILDLCTRKIVGWAMDTTLERTLVLTALTMARARQQPKRGVIFHSDRGCQYTSHEVKKTLKRHGFVQSMSRSACCYDNAVAESFFHTLKTEEVYCTHYATRTQARRAVFEYIEIFYNRWRLHSALGYLSPVEFEAKCAA